ncbi:MAG TPA: hypothetical protein VLJ68_03515 [Chitinophagaceae bacterium]|nr:hypothetical protein [Chitinophagaceae bacterium]
MRPIKNHILSLLAFAMLCLGSFESCRHKKKTPSLSGEEPVAVEDFIDFFPPAKLAYTFNDSILNKKEKDSLLISLKIFNQFVPDSFMIKNFGKGSKPRIYPLGKTKVPDGETYLFVKAIYADKRVAFILAFDKKDHYIAGMTAYRPDQLSTTTQSTQIDRRFTITKSIWKKNADASMNEGKDVYILNADAKEFLLIMTDALDDRLTELINPIDTLPRKNKVSADYSAGKMNLVSVRDGRRSDRVSFFIHFEKNNGACTGELKGEAIIRSNTVAEYREEGGPCVLRLIFSPSTVTLKEEEGCGSHRGLRCVFDGSYPKKKAVKPKPKK